MYLQDEYDKAKDIFKDLLIARMPPAAKNKVRGVVNSKADVIPFEGVVVKQEASYAFVRRNKYGDDIFLYREYSIPNWNDYKIGTNIKFNLAFNYKGPICIDSCIVK